MNRLKICCTCKLEKPLIEFTNHKNAIDGKHKQCRLCRKIYYQANKITIQKIAKEKRKQYPWISIWFGINQRCSNLNNPAYKYYGGRGILCLITIDEIKHLWFRDKAFKMKYPSIDRIDNDSNYCIENCRFLEKRDNTLKKNKEHPSTTKILQFDKQGIFIKEWSSIIEASKHIMRSPSSIQDVLHERSHFCANFIWKYKDLS
jgi:hypothetical protein